MYENDNYKNCNIGTSFLTSPINVTKEPKVLESLKSNKEYLLNNINKYAKKFEPVPGKPQTIKKKKSPE